MTRDDLLTLFRQQIDDVAKPYLWSDEEGDEYLDDAQNMFVRLTGGISDATSALCSFDVAIGDEFAPFDKRILKIRYAKRGDGTELKVTNFEDHSEPGNGERLTSTPGALVGLVVGMDDNNFRLRSIPAVADTVSLIIKRLPLVLDLSEIAVHHHPHLVAWMKYRAYSKHDAETLDKNKAEEFLQQFTSYCVKCSGESDTRKHKQRSVAYGGI